MIEAEGEPAVSQQGSFFRVLSGLGDEGSSCLGPLLYKTGHSKYKSPDFPVPPYYIYIYTYIHTYMHACIHTYIHTYIYIYIYIAQPHGEKDKSTGTTA